MNAPRDIDPADLANRFMFHPATEITGPKHDVWRAKCFELAAHMVATLPAGREKSLAVTALEECMMWGNAAIAREVR